MKSGHDIHEIAAIRGLKIGTIITHLVSMAISGREIPYSVISKEMDHDTKMRIVEELRYNGFFFKKQTKEALGDDVTYHQINLVIALLIACNKRNNN